MSAVDTTPGPMLLARLDAVAARLQRIARRPPGGLTPADGETGERWTASQVYAHIVEFVPYWLGQVRALLARWMAEQAPGREAAIDIGRSRDHADRIAGVAAGLDSSVPDLWPLAQERIGELRGYIAGLVDAEPWRAQGAEPAAGRVSLLDILDHHLVGHLEQHADQLEAIEITG